MSKWICLCLLLLAAPAWSDLVYTADGQPLYGQVRTGETGTVTVDSGEGPLVTLRREEVSIIEFRPPAAVHARTGSPQVVLRNGDRLNGTLRQIWPPAVVREEGTVLVPPAWVSTVRVKPGAALGAAGERDAVELANGDRVEGHVEGFHEGRLRVNTSLGPLAIDPTRVRGLVMARGEAPSPPERGDAAGIQASVETLDGERVTGEWLSLSATDIRLKPAWGAEIVLPVERATRLSVLNGRLTFLSDLHPAEVQETPYFDEPRPFQVDHSQGGRALRLGGRIFSRGLGVHSRSLLTYALAGSFKTFAATIGVDSEVGNGGSVIFRVMGDERPLFESPVIRGGDPPVLVSVDVSGVLLLRLEVDYADHGDLADHADWAEARLLK
jgi:hypothetical protein